MTGKDSITYLPKKATLPLDGVPPSLSAIFLSPAQIELIEYFADLAARFHLPRSAGQIYGLLFGQPAPVPFDHIVSTLGISKGSASSSLKLLRQLNGVHVHHPLGDRRTFYEAEASVRQLVFRFLEDGVQTHLRESEDRLRKITARVITENPRHHGDSTHLTKRLASLQAWHQKAQKLLPWIIRFTLGRKTSPPAKVPDSSS